MGRHADVWAAGVVLYELLSGSVPFKGANFTDLVVKIRDEAPPPLPEKTPRGERIPPPLATAVMRCLEKKPSDRFKSMAALGEALRPYAGKGGRAGRRGWLWPVAAAAAVAGAAAFAWLGTDLPARVRGLPDRASTWLSKQKVNVESALESAAPAPKAAHAPEKAEPPRAAAASRPSRHVEVSLRSRPSGATVMRMDSGEILGRTPLRATLPRRKGKLTLRFSLEGYHPASDTVDLRSDSTADVKLRPIRKRGGSARAR